MRTRAFSILAGLTLVGFSACVDTSVLPTGLRSVARDAQPLGGVLDETLSDVGEILVAPLHRTVPLSQPITWSFTVGPSGASSTSAETGLTVSVPADAVSETMTITVTALEGGAVAYRFAPHGFRFANRVRLTQSLSGLETGLLSNLLVQGAHFAGDEPVMVDGLAVVTETVSASLNLLENSVWFPIRHFSGWIVASGRSEDDGGQ